MKKSETTQTWVCAQVMIVYIWGDITVAAIGVELLVFWDRVTPSPRVMMIWHVQKKSVFIRRSDWQRSSVFVNAWWRCHSGRCGGDNSNGWSILAWEDYETSRFTEWVPLDDVTQCLVWDRRHGITLKPSFVLLSTQNPVLSPKLSVQKKPRDNRLLDRGFEWCWSWFFWVRLRIGLRNSCLVNMTAEQKGWLTGLRTLV